MNTYQFTYQIPVNWFNNNFDVAENNLIVASIAGMISRDFAVILQEPDKIVFVIKSGKSLEELVDYFNKITTRVERIIITYYEQ